MKKVIYNSWIARTMLFPRYTTITLAAWVCTRFTQQSEMPQSVRNHECTHARQWVEMFVSGWFIVWILQLLFDISPWWYTISFISFYLWYVLEWGVRSLLTLKNAYNNISFEREARMAEHNETYLENGDYFAWTLFLFL